MLIQDVFLSQRFPRPVLALQQHRATLQAFQAVPLSGRDVNERPAGDHVDGIGQPALLVIEVFLEMPPQAHNSLGSCPVPMDGKHRSGLNRIQHALGLILRRIPQIQVHTETRGCHGLGGQGVEGMLVDDQHFLLELSDLILLLFLQKLCHFWLEIHTFSSLHNALHKYFPAIATPHPITAPNVFITRSVTSK